MEYRQITSSNPVCSSYAHHQTMTIVRLARSSPDVC